MAGLDGLRGLFQPMILWLGKTSKIMKSNCHPNTTMPAISRAGRVFFFFPQSLFFALRIGRRCGLEGGAVRLPLLPGTHAASHGPSAAFPVWEGAVPGEAPSLRLLLAAWHPSPAAGHVSILEAGGSLGVKQAQAVHGGEPWAPAGLGVPARLVLSAFFCPGQPAPLTSFCIACCRSRNQSPHGVFCGFGCLIVILAAWGHLTARFL